jgi:DNA-binding MarR family transcriptional regulator
MTLIQHVERYLEESLGVTVAAQRWQDAVNLPFFLRDLYHFYQISLFGRPCLLVVAKDEEEQTPAVIRKHLSLIEEKRAGLPIYVHSLVSSYNRKRLIHHKIPFVVPRYQMYLPDLGIDLREHFRQARNSVLKFAPSTQAVIFYILLYPTEPYTPSWLASRLNYAAMTMSRSFDEIEAAGLGEIVNEGRERVLRLSTNKRDLWDDAQPFLSTPVKEKVWIEAHPFASLSVGERLHPKAGLTALAHYTDLAAPPQPVFALSGKDWKILQQHNGLHRTVSAEPDTVELEIWRYDPNLFAGEGVVDRLSLYLSLLAIHDERVEAALAHMMELLPW